MSRLCPSWRNCKWGAGFESAISGRLVSPAGRPLKFFYFMYQFWVIYGPDELRLGWCALWGILLKCQVTYLSGWPCQNQYVLFTLMIMIHSQKPGIWHRLRTIFKIVGLQYYYEQHKGSKQCTENKQKRERDKNMQKGGRQTTMQNFTTAHPQEACTPAPLVSMAQLLVKPIKLHPPTTTCTSGSQVSWG